MDTLFFYSSKIVWLLLSPDLILVLWLALGLVLLWRNRISAARRSLTLCILLILAIAVLPMGHWLYAPLENRFKPVTRLPPSIDGIICLAGAENIRIARGSGQVELNRSAERLLAFMRLVRRYPDARAVFTGGSGDLVRQQDKSTRVALQLFEAQGLDTGKILFEPDSRNTWENAVFTRDRVNPRPDQRWLLITTAAHMPRSVGVFETAGFTLLPYPVDHLTYPGSGDPPAPNFSANLSLLKTALREWTGLLAYWLTGKTSCFFPGPAD